MGTAGNLVYTHCTKTVLIGRPGSGQDDLHEAALC